MEALLPTSPPKSELALQKGFRRRTWTGPAWLDNVTSTGHVQTHLMLLPMHAIDMMLHVAMCSFCMLQCAASVMCCATLLSSVQFSYVKLLSSGMRSNSVMPKAIVNSSNSSSRSAQLIWAGAASCASTWQQLEMKMILNAAIEQICDM